MHLQDSDPPYHPDTRRRSRVYRHDYSISDHKRLLDLLRSLRCKVIISGYTNDLYSQQLSDWKTRAFTAKTHVGTIEETMWFNFEPPIALHDSRYLGNDFRSRQTVKRRFARLKRKVADMDPLERELLSRLLIEEYPTGTAKAVS